MVPGDYGRICPHCKNQVGLRPQANLDSANRNGSRIYLHVCTCPVCGKGVILEADSLDELRVVYPDVLPNSWDVSDVPETILESYLESVTAYTSGAFGLTAVGCRRTVEAVARDKDISGKYAKTMIQEMVKKGLLTPQFAEAIDHVRLQGNTGAHTGPISQDEAERTLRFTQELLRILYEIPAELKKVATPQEPLSQATETAIPPTPAS